VKRKCKNSLTPSKTKSEDHGFEEGEEVQAKGICNIFNKIITEIFLNLEKTMINQAQEASRTLNRTDQNRTTP
jgi:hypothetical protein